MFESGQGMMTNIFFLCIIQGLIGPFHLQEYHSFRSAMSCGTDHFLWLMINDLGFWNFMKLRDVKRGNEISIHGKLDRKPTDESFVYNKWRLTLRVMNLNFKHFLLFTFSISSYCRKTSDILIYSSSGHHLTLIRWFESMVQASRLPVTPLALGVCLKGRGRGWLR